MLYTKRGIFRLTALLTTGFILAVVVGSVWLYSCQLPSPESANREELLEWLVTRDLSDESPHTRSVLARRLDSEFVNVDWENLNGRMTSEYRRRLWQNLPLLLDPWFLDKLESYYKQEESQRPVYIDSIIDRISDLSGINSLQESGLKGESPNLVKLFLERVAAIKSQAEGERRERIEQFVNCIQTRWLCRNLFAEPSVDSKIKSPATNAP